MKKFFRPSLSSRRRLKMFLPYSTELKKFLERSTPSLLSVFPRGARKMATARLTKFYPKRALPLFAGKRIWDWDVECEGLRTPLLVRRGGCGIKKISAKPTLAPQTGWSLNRYMTCERPPRRFASTSPQEEGNSRL